MSFPGTLVQSDPRTRVPIQYTYNTLHTLPYQYIRAHVRTTCVRVYNMTLNNCRIMLIVGDQDICFGVLMF